MHQILLIDDDELVLRSLGRLLTRQGYRVESATSGKEAIEKIRTNEFDLIVSDVRMPGVDGIECVRYIRQFETTAGRGLTPEIFITGYSDDQARTRADSLAIRDYVQKPFDNLEFLDIVRLRLSQRKADRRKNKSNDQAR